MTWNDTGGLFVIIPMLPIKMLSIKRIRSLAPLRSLVLCSLLASAGLSAQAKVVPAKQSASSVLTRAAAKPEAVTANEPIPDVSTLLKQVQAKQRKMVVELENYTYREVNVTKQLDKHGKVVKTTSETCDVFFVNGHEINRLIAENGHPLSAKEQKKEQERVQKAVAQAVKTSQTQSLNHNTVSMGQLLSIMTLSHPQRVMVAGRPAFVFNFVGNPHAHTHGVAEDASKKISGSLWVDEQDRITERLQADFDANFHLGWGVFTLDKGSAFNFQMQRVAPGIWLPSVITMHLVAHAFGFMGYRAEVVITDSNYQVFHVTAETFKGSKVSAASPGKTA